MGMYDYVEFKTKCPNCKKEIDGFQTKDGRCIMDTLNFWEVDNFYSSCECCGTWVTHTLESRPNRKITIKDYKMVVRISKIKNKAGPELAGDHNKEKSIESSHPNHSPQGVTHEPPTCGRSYRESKVKSEDTSQSIKAPMKSKNVYPYGDVPVVDFEKLKKEGCGEFFEKWIDGNLRVLNCGEKDVEDNIELCPKCSKKEGCGEIVKQIENLGYMVNPFNDKYHSFKVVINNCRQTTHYFVKAKDPFKGSDNNNYENSEGKK